MPERSFAEQLDELIDSLLGSGETPASGSDDLNALLHLAADLRDLPSPAFKARLKSDLQRRISMTATTALPYVREGFHAVTPYIIGGGAAEMIDFVKQAFGAEETFRSTGAAGGIHCELRLGDSMVMLGGKWRLQRPHRPGSLALLRGES